MPIVPSLNYIHQVVQYAKARVPRRGHKKNYKLRIFTPPSTEQRRIEERIKGIEGFIRYLEERRALWGIIGISNVNQLKLDASEVREIFDEVIGENSYQNISIYKEGVIKRLLEKCEVMLSNLF